ncbi:MAG TPA: hypothetical protein PKK10_14685 [Woeseiaceae bacterium]|nr:hypothetical protein [Woeseiaceae bacterium]
MQERDDNPQDEQLGRRLSAYQPPPPARGFYESAVQRALVARQQKKDRRRHLLGGLFGGLGVAAAAGLVAFLVGPMIAGVDDDSSELPEVTIALAEAQTVRLVFSSTEALVDATLTVSLPPGVELQGFPGQREVSWETSLAAGQNVLPLRLLAVGPTGGELLAHLEHDSRDKSFSLRISVT